MDIDVRDCPLATIEGLQKVCILIEPGDIEAGKAALADPHRRETKDETETIIIALLEIGAIKGGK